MRDCIITYQKSNGEIFIRPYSTSIGKEIGNETSMGWTILDIHYKYKNNYYCYNDFKRIFNKEVQEKKNKKFIKLIIKILIKYANCQ